MFLTKINSILKLFEHLKDTDWTGTDVRSGISDWFKSVTWEDEPSERHPNLRGLLRDGQPHFLSAYPLGRGISWKARGKTLNDGWLYGSVNKTSHFTGDGIAFVYPDLSTALLGRFRHEVMLAAKEVRIRAIR